MKTIIVPIDFSEYSLKGLQLAVLFAKKIKANIEMVYVQKKTGEYFPSIREQQLKWASEKFEEIKKKYCGQLHRKNKLDYIIKHGKVHQEVVHQAQSYKDSMIITSTHGVSGFDEIFLGSNATKIIALSDRPVITINIGNCPVNIYKIVMPIDHTKETRQKVNFTIEIAKAFHAEIHVVPVIASRQDDLSKKAETYAKQVCAILEKEKIQYKYKMLCGKNVPDMVIKYAEHKKADLISIMSEQTPSISSLLLGSQAELVLTKSKIPVLTITPKDLYMTVRSY
ncbi:MAG: universal stress protein [Bacteroidetes bacterium]|nr:universal stress protein [Bacteroidota bacterium]